MLRITIPAVELYDEDKNEFYTFKEQHLQLEHSLVSLSKWESKWCKPIFNNVEKNIDESIDYVRCMTLTQNVDESVYNRITTQILQEVEHYISLPMTATKIYDVQKKTKKEQVTAELIYYWMIALNIPFECQKWHLNRLIMLIRVCNLKNAPPKKTNRNDLLARNASLNAARREALKTKG